MPIELFLFQLGVTDYAFTNSETAQTRLAVTYQPETIWRSEIMKRPVGQKEDLRVRVPSTNALVQLFDELIPGSSITFTLLQRHVTDSAAEYVQLFKGYVATVSFSKDGREAVIVIQPQTAKSLRTIPRRTFSRLCNNTHYGARCGLSVAAYQEVGTVIGISSRVIQVAGLTNLSATDYWERGFVRFGDEYRLVNLQTNDFFTLNIPFRNSPLGSSVIVAPGCKHRLDEDCTNKYSNTINYGGFPYVPQKNPFSSGLD